MERKVRVNRLLTVVLCALLQSTVMTASGELQTKRSGQQVRWMWSMLDDSMMAILHENKDVKLLLEEVETSVREGRMPASLAVEKIMERLMQSVRSV